MCPYKETAEHKFGVHPFTDESHPQGWQSNTEKLKAFTAQKTVWKSRRVKEWRAENIRSTKRSIFKLSALPVLISSMKSCILRSMFQPGGIGSINTATRKLLRTGRHNSFYSFNLLTDQVYACSWFIFLPILIGRTVGTHPYETVKQL